MSYVMDGYRDLDMLADKAAETGLTMGSPSRAVLKARIAAVLHLALTCTDQHEHHPGSEGQRRTCMSQDFFDASWGIVNCAQMDELI